MEANRFSRTTEIFFFTMMNVVSGRVAGDIYIYIYIYYISITLMIGTYSRPTRIEVAKTELRIF